jgi:thioredoxin
MPGLTIGKLAAAEGVGVETVRFYQRRGLLSKPERRGSGYREYSEADRERLVFIRRARQLGFTLGEIGDLLGPAQANSTAEIARAAQAKLADVQAQARELELLTCRLRRLLYVCEHGDGRDCATLQLGERPEVERSPRPVIVEYWAQWCPPCRQVAPVLDAIAAEYDGVVDVVKVNVDENPQTAGKYGVLHVPTMSLFADGQVVRQVIGARSKAALLREFAGYVPPAS